MLTEPSEDINGDGRDDWLWVGDVGQTTTWTNSRSCAKGQLGNGLNVAWRQGHYQSTSSGPTHPGVGGEFGVTGIRNNIHFARIYGEPRAFGLLPNADYVYMHHTKKDGEPHKWEVHVWKNIGSGGTKLEGESPFVKGPEVLLMIPCS